MTSPYDTIKPPPLEPVYGNAGAMSHEFWGAGIRFLIRQAIPSFREQNTMVNRYGDLCRAAMREQALTPGQAAEVAYNIIGGEVFNRTGKAAVCTSTNPPRFRIETYHGTHSKPSEAA